MNPKYSIAEISKYNSVFENCVECAAEAVLSMPDYCPEIKRILKSYVEVNNTTVHRNSGFADIKADVSFRIIYVGEDGSLASYEQPHHVEKKVEISCDDECIINCSMLADYINSRAISPRKVDVKASLTLKIKGFRLRKESILCSADGGGIQVKSEEHQFAEIIALSEKTFSLSETAEIAKDKKPISKILANNAYLSVNEVKTINNKALVKGNCIITVNYLPERGDKPECCEFSLPVSQIIETEGLKENSKINLKNTITNFEAVPRVDASGEIRLIDLNLRVQTVLTAFEESKISFIKDCYSTEFPLKTESKKIEICEFIDSFKTDFTNKVVLESIGVTVEEVLSAWCSDLKYNFTHNDECCVLSGSYQACVIYKDSDNQIELIQKPIEFDYALNLKNQYQRIMTLGEAQLTACSCSVSGESRLEMKTEIILSADVFALRTVDYISKAVVEDTDDSSRNSCALTVCFCNKGENLWNIARRYNTTVEAIKSENGIDDDEIAENKMILVPCNF